MSKKIPLNNKAGFLYEFSPKSNNLVKLKKLTSWILGGCAERSFLASCLNTSTLTLCLFRLVF